MTTTTTTTPAVKEEFSFGDYIKEKSTLNALFLDSGKSSCTNTRVYIFLFSLLIIQLWLSAEVSQQNFRVQGGCANATVCHSNCYRELEDPALDYCDSKPFPLSFPQDQAFIYRNTSTEYFETCLDMLLEVRDTYLSGKTLVNLLAPCTYLCRDPEREPLPPRPNDSRKLCSEHPPEEIDWMWCIDERYCNAALENQKYWSSLVVTVISEPLTWVSKQVMSRAPDHTLKFVIIPYVFLWVVAGYSVTFIYAVSSFKRRLFEAFLSSSAVALLLKEPTKAYFRFQFAKRQHELQAALPKLTGRGGGGSDSDDEGDDKDALNDGSGKKPSRGCCGSGKGGEDDGSGIKAPFYSGLLLPFLWAPKSTREKLGLEPRPAIPEHKKLKGRPYLDPASGRGKLRRRAMPNGGSDRSSQGSGSGRSKGSRRDGSSRRKPAPNSEL